MYRTLKVSLNTFFSNSFYFLFFFSLLGTVIPGYVFIIFSLLGILCCAAYSKWGIFSFTLVCVLLGLKLNQMSLWADVEVLFRYFLGWIVVYAFLYYTKARIDINRLIFLYSIAVIVEAVLVNTIFPASMMPNYPNLELVPSHQTHFMGFYQRVYSVGCNATVSSTIMCLLLTYREALNKNGYDWNNWKIDVLAGISIVLFASGTGFCLYTIYLLYKRNLLKWKNTLLAVLALFLLIFISTSFADGTDSIFSRFSYIYMQFLWNFKEEQIMDAIYLLELDSFFLGCAYNDIPLQLWGDFAIRDFFISWGFFGFMILFAFVLKNINKINALVLLLSIIGLFHYGGVFSFPGQLCFAYALLLNHHSIAYYGVPKITTLR